MLDDLHFFKIQQSAGYGPFFHAENQLLVQWARAGLQGDAIQQLVNAWVEGIYDGVQLHIVIFTQLPPCDSCQGAFPGALAQMATQLDEDVLAAGGQAPIEPGQIGITLDVFGSTYVPSNRTNAQGEEDTNDPQGRQNAMWPGTLRYGITDYWNGYVYSPDGNWAAVY